MLISGFCSRKSRFTRMHVPSSERLERLLYKDDVPFEKDDVRFPKDAVLFFKDEVPFYMDDVPV